MFSFFGDSKESKAVVVRAPDPDAVSSTMYRVLWGTVISYFEYIEDFEKIAEASPRVLYDYFVGKTHKPMIEDESAEFYHLLTGLAQHKVKLADASLLQAKIAAACKMRLDEKHIVTDNSRRVSTYLTIGALLTAYITYVMIDQGVNWVLDSNAAIREQTERARREGLDSKCTVPEFIDYLVDNCIEYNSGRGCKVDRRTAKDAYGLNTDVDACGYYCLNVDTLSLCKEIGKAIYNNAAIPRANAVAILFFSIVPLILSSNFVCCAKEGFCGKPGALNMAVTFESLGDIFKKPMKDIFIDLRVAEKIWCFLKITPVDFYKLTFGEVSKLLTQEIEKCNEWIMKQEASPTGKPGGLSPMMRLKNRLFAPKAVTVEVVVDEERVVVIEKAAASN